MTKRIIVTGASGFIGSRIALRFRDLGYDVINLDRNDRDLPGIQSVNCDIQDFDSVSKIVTKGVDAIAHFAAKTSVLESKKDPMGFFSTNVIGTQNLLEAARLGGITTFAFASTNAVVGSSKPPTQVQESNGAIPSLSDSSTVASNELLSEKNVLYPLTPYGATKAANEMLSASYQDSYGMTVAPLRLTNVYGTDMFKKDSIVPRIMRSLLGGPPLEIYGDGLQWRDYVYLSDVTDAFELAITRNWVGPVSIGSGESFSVKEIIDFTQEVTGIEVPANFGPARTGEMRGVKVDISKAKALGYAPKVDIRHGLKEVFEDFANKKNS
ncbi:MULTISPECIES: NAD-dependent epimerase/dehydratase family protein [Acidithrix]|uniref:dTDP-glucose 4,6-dehydratase n=1 Tax=Acidithrix ferrooxidans TaxID=1280514 RepID=A0A0D8HGV3_9ACTN|nr:MULTISPECIES: NAD-dependent epimerase/dehydratase family protein [Acidithrix]KJF17225.1 dTDP-glucose 4,6-dehydratase [Acidithrix ferrooxidans]CAG4914126.1 unnamed protein product [Acidithrix sp. C25]